MSELAFKELFEAAPGLYLVLAIDAPRFTIVAASERYLRATLTTRDAILGQPLFTVFPDNPNDPQATGVANLSASLDRVIRQGVPDPMAVQKYDIRRPEDGSFEERYWSPVNFPVVTDGVLRAIIHRVEDVTEFVLLQRSGSEARARAERLEVRANEMEREVVRRAQELQEANRQLRELHAQLEERVELRTTELHRANAAIRREISSRERTEQVLNNREEQLRQAQKLEAVGRLAGGVAHDFNNLLSVILMCCSVIREGVSFPDEVLGQLAEIETAGQRATELTRQLLAFSRQQVLEARTLDVNAILRELGKMINRIVGEDIDVQLALGEQVGSIRADRSQLEQVVMNLVVNARDALPDGGLVRLQTSNVELDDEYAAQHPGVTPGPHVLLTVADDGVGMDAATQSRVFEPFFTTKERGKGTGLGLATVFGVVKQSGGHIWLYSEVGCGTTFKLYFPRVDGVPVTQVVPVTSARRELGATEVILLVEDQPQVRAAARRVLRRAGYEILEAATPLEALELFGPRAENVDLLLTDFIMPGMNGRQLAERLRGLKSSIKILFMSGYTDDAIIRNGALEGAINFIGKPLTPERLLAKVREVLDAS